MPKFVIEQDSSRKNALNEPLPLGQFVPGILSLKNTNQTYKLFVGDINNGSLVDDINVFKGNLKLYEQLLTLLPRLRNDVIAPNLKIFSDSLNQKTQFKKNIVDKNTGSPKPYTFINIDTELIPHPNKNVSKEIRKKIIDSTPPSIPSVPINLGNLLLPSTPQTKLLQNKVNEIINKPINKLTSLPQNIPFIRKK